MEGEGDGRGFARPVKRTTLPEVKMTVRVT